MRGKVLQENNGDTDVQDENNDLSNGSDIEEVDNREREVLQFFGVFFILKSWVLSKRFHFVLSHIW